MRDYVLCKNQITPALDGNLITLSLSPRLYDGVQSAR